MQSESDSEGEFFDATESQLDSSGVHSPTTCIKEAREYKNTKRRSFNTREETAQNQEKRRNKKERRFLRKLKTKGKDPPASVGCSETESLPSPVQHLEQNQESKNENEVKTQLSPSRTKPEEPGTDNETSVTPETKKIVTENSTKLKESQGKIDKESNSESSTPISEKVSAITGSRVNSNEVIAEVLETVSKQDNAPPPVAPPRRKRKKKLAEQAVTEGKDHSTDGGAEVTEPHSPETPSSPAVVHNVTTAESLPSDSVRTTSVIPEQFEQDLTAAHLASLLEQEDDDPSIQLDYKSQEMKIVLEKASSTEVIPALTLDSRFKSHSVTSLGSSGTRSDSFMSVSSLVSNGPPLNKAGSSTSVGSSHSYQQSSSGHGGKVRASSVSGRPLSDIEILEQVLVKNLDTGESIPLSLAEERLPKGTNPLALHIMRLTSEYSSDTNLSAIDQEDGVEDVGRKVKKKTKKLKKFLGRTVNKIKSEKRIKEVTVKEGQRSEDSSSSDEENASQETPTTTYIKIKSAHGKGPEEFEKLKLLQDLSGEHVGAVWTIKFSVCGRLMATAGQDHMVRVWVLKECEDSFEEMRAKYSKPGTQPSSVNPEEDPILSEQEDEEGKDNTNDEEKEDGKEENKDEDDKNKEKKDTAEEDDPGPFKKTPFCTYCGHTGDVLDLSWSKNYFLLSSSMDKTVRLWHISRTECLCCFQHIDFVTAIVFHPRDDRYFLSGSLDGKIRLWNIPDKKVALWNEVEGAGSNLITAANFCLQGKFAVVGTYDGRCIFYETERLKYHTQWQVRSSRNKRARGRKISGIEPMPGEEKVLITSNDSRIRLYDLKDNSLYCKYKGCSNTSSQIKASFSHDGQYLVCGSEDHFVYIWRTQHGIPSSRRDKNEFYESFSAHDAVVTAAIFAPVPWQVVAPDTSGSPVTSEVLVTADWGGAIKLFVNR